MGGREVYVYVQGKYSGGSVGCGSDRDGSIMQWRWNRCNKYIGYVSRIIIRRLVQSQEIQFDDNY